MICDTSALLAALIRDQRNHEECAAHLSRAQIRIVPSLVLAELDYLVGRHLGQRAAIRIARALTSNSYEIASLESDGYVAATGVMDTYRDLRLGLVDASLVVMAKRYRTHDILTLDQRHFRVVRSLEGRPFRILPFDADEEPE